MNPLVWPIIAGAPLVVMEISLQSGNFVSQTNPMKALKISSPLVCLFNGKMVSHSSLALMSSKTILMKTQLCHIHHISRLVKLEGKAFTRINILLQLLLDIAAIPSLHLVVVLRETCTSLMAFTISVLFLKSSKRPSAALRKASFTI